jgi:hypothetical protein
MQAAWTSDVGTLPQHYTASQPRRPGLRIFTAVKTSKLAKCVVQIYGVLLLGNKSKSHSDNDFAKPYSYPVL